MSYQANILKSEVLKERGTENLAHLDVTYQGYCQKAPPESSLSRLKGHPLPHREIEQHSDRLPKQVSSQIKFDQPYEWISNGKTTLM